MHRSQTVDKVLGFLPRIFCIKEAKSQYFQDFSVSFWYNKGIKKAVLFYDDTRNRKSKKANADGMY